MRSGRSSSPLRSGWRRWFPLLLGILLLVLAPMVASAQGGGPDSVSLSWTAPGDDGAIGTATGYELRISTAPITSGNWSAAAVVPGLPAPVASGTRQSTMVRSLSRDTVYYFALRTVDDSGNWSGISNLVRWDWTLDAAPPAAPTQVSAARHDPGVRVAWAANSEIDLEGYSVYRAVASSGPYTRITGSLVNGTSHVDPSPPTGVTRLYYRVSASDLSGNESAHSAVAAVDLAVAAAPGEWAMSPGYPNPSRTGHSVCLPFVMPAAGPGDATLEVTDAGGRRVRRVAVAAATACAGGILWDGRNDAGREVAPGIYRAWLISGDRREHVRLVRQP